ncbi:MAG: F0F1 ATP synthase subunit gamma, partial [Anaerolineae bacterium]|nr:F0F1 ATP synthase subunit gamma [Anaerolineae bacterium]
YNHTVEMGLQIALRHRPAEIKIAQRVLSGPLGAIVFGSDQGMVGQFNQEITDHAIAMVTRGALRERDCTVMAIGRRVAARLAQAGQPPIETLPVPSSSSGITPMVQDILVRLDIWREGRGKEQAIEQILLFYNTPSRGASYRATMLQLLPVDLRWLDELERREWPSPGLPTYTLEWDALFAALIREYFFVSLYRAFSESLAS